MHISEWQLRLEQRFNRLAGSRKPSGSVFVLEHGLNEAELRDLTEQVRRQIALGFPRPQQWLVWLVYATEIGYHFTGHEYWTTFETDTPGWRERGDRYLLQDWFHRFVGEYSGAQPKGEWADWFTIICWPITHAFLPADLQTHLARVLYETRFSLTYGTLTDTDHPETLGNLVASRAHTGTKRFQQFCTNPQLIGRIAQALLAHEKDAPVIDPDTFARVLRDLESTHSARIWLNGARKRADQLRKTGFAPSRAAAPPTYSPAPSQPTQHAAETRLRLEPELLLRPVDDESWQPRLVLQDFSPLAARFPAVQKFLESVRCRLPCGERRWRSRGQLLGRETVENLAEWPQPGQLLLEFETVGGLQAPQELLSFLRSDCQFRAEPLWLFKVGTGGGAREVRGRTVTPGGDYIVVTRGGAPTIPGGRRVLLNCAGASATQVAVPEHIDSVLQDALRKQFIQTARRIAVWPVGPPPVAWDSEGHAMWLTTDPPTIALSLDHATTTVVLQLDGQLASAITLLPDQFARGPVFVSLPELPPGTHRLVATSTSTQFGTSGTSQLTARGELALTIRPPRPWDPGTAPQSALFVLPEPLRPTLEEVWSGQGTFEMRGPAGDRVTCHISLLDRSNDTLLTAPIGPLVLPVSRAAWQEAVLWLESNDEALNAIDQAYRLKVEVTSPDLGHYALLCERTLTPVRWAVRYDRRSGHTVELIDDTESGDPLSVWFYPTSDPITPRDLPYSPHERTYAVPPEGGLFVAASQPGEVAIVAPPQVKSLLEVGRFRPWVRWASGSPSSLARLMLPHRRWATARLIAHVLRRWTQDAATAAIVKGMRGRVLPGSPYAGVPDEVVSDELVKRYRELAPDGCPISDQQFDERARSWLERALKAAKARSIAAERRPPAPPLSTGVGMHAETVNGSAAARPSTAPGVIARSAPAMPAVSAVPVDEPYTGQALRAGDVLHMRCAHSDACGAKDVRVIDAGREAWDPKQLACIRCGTVLRRFPAELRGFALSVSRTSTGDHVASSTPRPPAPQPIGAGGRP